MLVLCIVAIVGRVNPWDHAAQNFTNGIMIDCSSSRDIHQSLQNEMTARLMDWKGPITPMKWRLAAYLPANGKPEFGPGVIRSLRMGPPMAEQAIPATQTTEVPLGDTQ